MVDGYVGRHRRKISTASYPYNDYLNQVLLQIRGGTLTGAVQVDVAWLATLAATGKLVDLSSIAGKADYTDSVAGHRQGRKASSTASRGRAPASV